jgi:Ni/Fe-hydrogenase subunit HybB-like protein
MHIIVFVHGKNWEYLNTRMGLWYLVEMIGFVLVPMILFFISYRKYKVNLVKVAAIIAMLGIVINRLNVSIIAYRWDAAVPYYPTWMEVVVTFTIIFAEVWVFRWVVNRMPVYNESPKWAKDQGH